MPADQLLTWIEGHEDTQCIKKKSVVVDMDTQR
jgi:hypothetical protein